MNEVYQNAYYCEHLIPTLTNMIMYNVVAMSISELVSCIKVSEYSKTYFSLDYITSFY